MTLTNLDIPPLERGSFNLNGRQVPFVFPAKDDTIWGTLSCLQANRFHLSEISFSPGDSVIDIGCNIGLVSLVIAITKPYVNVFAFDANPLAIKCLRESSMLNGLTNIFAYNVAVGNASAKGLRFFSNGKELSCAMFEDLAPADHLTLAGTVNQIGIDEIFDSSLLGIDRIRYAKIDVEGAEYTIFDRLYARPELLDRIDYLHLEIHDFKDKGPDALKAKVSETFGARVFFDT